MYTTKEEFRERIESLRTVKYGSVSFFKWGAEYRLKSEGETEIFGSFEELWDRASRHLELELAINAPKGQHKEINDLPISAQWGDKKRCVICGVWKWPAEYDEYPSTIINASDWCRECMSKRDISPRQEEIIRLCHQDMGYCRTQKEVAVELGISEATVSSELAEVRGVAPGLFPLLTEFEAECCDCYINEGMVQADIAVHLTSLKDESGNNYLGIVTRNKVAQAIKRARDKGLYVMSKRFRSSGKILHYDAMWMNERIKYGSGYFGDVKRKF